MVISGSTIPWEYGYVLGDNFTLCLIVCFLAFSNVPANHGHFSHFLGKLAKPFHAKTFLMVSSSSAQVTKS